tara:strand:+ start:395 stop:655 length:261 start_codon:yes stop_codon:yes gene_type:complete
MKEIILNAEASYLKGALNKHLANVSLLIDNPTGVAQHEDIMASIEKELGHIAEYDGKLQMLFKYIAPPQPKTEGKSNDKDSTVTKK